MTYENMRCGDCGERIHFDCVIPNEVWNAACGDADMLCFVCIDRRVAAVGAECECEFYAVGAAVKSRLYDAPAGVTRMGGDAESGSGERSELARDGEAGAP